MLKRLCAFALALPLSACATDLMARGLGGFNESGGANWTFADGVAQAANGEGIGYLFSKEDYRDFDLTAQIYVGDPHNSGIFFRCSDRTAISATTCYEANIYDKRPDQSGRTGAVPGFFTPPLAQVNAAGKWNTITIRAKGAHITITVNGVKTVEADGPLMSSGPIALQWGEGDVRFRKLRVRRL